jgi:hypothetical protein
LQSTQQDVTVLFELHFGLETMVMGWPLASPRKTLAYSQHSEDPSTNWESSRGTSIVISIAFSFAISFAISITHLY